MGAWRAFPSTLFFFHQPQKIRAFRGFSAKPRLVESAVVNASNVIASAKAGHASARSPKRIFIVDDHPVFREGLISLLQRDPTFSIVGEAATVEAALLALETMEPDLVVADLGLPDKDGTELIKQIAARHPSLPILVLSMHDEMHYAQRVLAAGAKGYLMKQQDSATILEGVRRVLGGEIHVSPQVSNALLQKMTGTRATEPSDGVANLTPREFDVFQLIGRGKTCRDIAGELNLSIKTVNVYRGHIKRKLDLKSGAQLIRCAALHAATGN